ncbi:MAG: coproporphyrinogen dehydrogenase, partial [Leptospiraceae bacterium]|nr:coproporphyrinogen dehydrogenase [Leptospiraceae bacterium]
RKEQLEVLQKLQFSRISLGVQDFNSEVQKLINRNQTFEDTKRVTDIARELGYTSINYDLVYGLPRQTKESISYTIEKTVEIKPDRIAFYSYAHVPWIKASHRLFTEDDLPKGSEKRTLYETGRNIFSRNGYEEIGMDHFALRTDGLWKSSVEGRLHRNFMGYTENKTDVQLGLGVSAISDSWYAFHQNEKILKRYDKRILSNELPTLRGHKLNSEDLQQRAYILELSTKWEVSLSEHAANRAKKYLTLMEADRLIEWQGNKLTISGLGKPFLRNICMGLDFRLQDHVPETRVFSRAI